MPAPWFLSTLLILCAPPTGPDKPPAKGAESKARRAEVAIRYAIHSEGHPQKVTLTSLVPQDCVPFQDVESIRYEPAPSEVFDRDGQRYARFVLVKPAEETLVEIRLMVRLEREDIESGQLRKKDKAASAPALDGDEKKRALRSEPYIESDDLSIRKLAAKIPDKNDKNQLLRTRTALELTLAELSPAPYNSADIGAKQALSEKRGDCTEYSDLFAAILRADAIPARRSYGFLIESGNTPKHDWVEVFLDDLGWVAVDPLHVARGAATFERTKPIYIKMSTLRNDDNLASYHYFVYRNEGGTVKVEDEFKVLGDTIGEAEAKTEGSRSGSPETGQH